MHWLFHLSVSLVALLGPAGPELQRYEAVEPHMGTLVRITVYAPGEQAANIAFRAAFERIRHLDHILSDYRPDSELARVTREPVGRAVPVSDDLFAVLQAAQDLARATDGAFDVTQGPVVQLWREARTSGRIPDPAALRAAARRSGFRKLHLDAARRTVTFDTAGMALDVGAIGKGYGASEAVKALRAVNVRRALVAVSGDLAFGDAPPGQRGWRIQVHPGDPSVSFPAVLELVNAAVSTSGSSAQHVTIDGRRYSHVIDPASGMGLSDDVTVTVIAPGGLEADGLDTAISVLGAARGLELVESRPGAAALVLERNSQGTTAVASSQFLELASTHGVAASPPGP